MIFIAQIISAQEENEENRIAQLNMQKEQIINVEKDTLKIEVERINDRLIHNEITKEEAQRLKEAVAKKHALNIENKIAIIENKIALIKRNGSNYMLVKDTAIWSEEEIDSQRNSKKLHDFYKQFDQEKEIKYDIRTQSNLMLAVGLNNALIEGQSLEDSDYRVMGSRFFEIGWVWRTRVFKNTNIMRIKYGISYMSNGLKPTDNRYFVENGNQTFLETFDEELEKSKFRTDHLVVPIHLEFGSSRLEKNEKSIRYRTTDQFKIGFGGYLGANISTRQKLKYRVDGDEIKDKIKQDYNSSDLIYGVSTYIGLGDTSIYAKLDMSPIFKNADIDQNNVSLGIRFDL